MIKPLSLFLLLPLSASLSFAKDKLNPDGSPVLNYQFTKNEKTISFNKGSFKVSADMFNKSTDKDVRLFACLDCHGKNAQGGVFYSDTKTYFNPSLVGLSKDYIKSELHEFKNKERISDEMNIIASLLNDDTIDFVAQTLSDYPPVPLLPKQKINQLMATDERFQKGEKIAMQGTSNNVIACMACHGINGIGAIGPRLAGQNAGYIIQQMKNYVSGDRPSDSLMTTIANNITDQEIAAVAYYYDSLSDSNPYSYRDKYIYEKDE